MVYQGSKTKYSKYIIPIIEDTLKKNNSNIFIDGCCGGCNIIQDVNAKYRIAIDINNNLIELYKYAVNAYKNNKWESSFPEKITREDWDNAKNGNCSPWFTALVCFFASYSARGFSGGYCLNSKRDYYNERLINFKNQIPKLLDVEFICEDINNIDIDNSVIYIDPPYLNTKKYDINSNFNYDKFWDSVRRLSEKNTVLVSEQVAPDDFKSIWSITTNRNCFGSKPTSAIENIWILNKETI